MEVHVLGAHGCESREHRLVSLLIDEVLALDAGSLTSSLTFAAQARVKAILLSHPHFDHVRDLASFGMNAHLGGTTCRVYGIAQTFDVLFSHLLNGVLYPDFSRWPTPEQAPLAFQALEPYREEVIEGYRVVAVPVCHSLPTVGYLVASPEGKSLFFTGDTGPGWAARIGQLSPGLIVTECFAPNRFREFAMEKGHMAPRLIGQELAEFGRLRGYLPRVLLVHLTPLLEEEEVRGEVRVIAQELGADIDLAHEGMRVSL